MSWYIQSSFEERGLDSSNAKLTEWFIHLGWVLNGDGLPSVCKLPQILDWPELYQKYPDLAEIKVKHVTFYRDPEARALAIGKNPFRSSPYEWTMYLNPNKAFNSTPSKLAKIIMHEITHFIRYVENKPSGTSSTDPHRKQHEGEIEARENARSYYGGPWPDNYDISKGEE